MNRKMILVVAVLLALIGGGVVVLVRNANDKSNQNVSQDSATYKQFAELKGEEYDRMFLASMIAHHQGAVDMANLALNQAKHSELQAMAGDIVAAQTDEIRHMENWQKSWGYPASSGAAMMDHSAMGMADDMTAMTSQLKDLTGDAFDKKFLALMVEHHQSAIDMSRPASHNAHHQEVKTLAQDIITAQTKEISRMRAWQQDWGY